MVNVRKFDEEEVLEKILYVFWEKGYDSTSLDDLIKATNVKRQSLYNAFGNKDDMFILAYERYLKRTKKVIKAVAHATDVPLAEALRAMLITLTNEIKNPNSPPGCFIANSTVEFANKDGEITTKLQQYYREIEQLFNDVLLHAQLHGRLSKDKSPSVLAMFLIGNITSIAVLYRLNQNPELITSMIDEMLLLFT